MNVIKRDCIRLNFYDISNPYKIDKLLVIPIKRYTTLNEMRTTHDQICQFFFILCVNSNMHVKQKSHPTSYKKETSEST